MDLPEEAKRAPSAAVWNQSFPSPRWICLKWLSELHLPQFGIKVFLLLRHCLNSPKGPPYWNSTSGFDLDHITAVDLLFCTSLRNFIQIGPLLAEKMTSCRFSRWRILAILDFKGPITGSLKSPCTTFYRSSIDTIALNCLVFEKIAFLQFGDRQTDEQMDTPVAWSRSRCRERRLNKRG